MIPKIIHYCWFGRGEMPKSAYRCIDSWKKFLPEYEIKLWNEDNFDVNIIPYTQEAYAAKKYAFVSDFARFWILYRYGGLYFDTDVEIIQPLDDIIEKGPFMGCEKDAIKIQGSDSPHIVGAVAPGLGLGVNPGLGLGVNPGLGLGVNPGLGVYKEILDLYSSLHFQQPNQEGGFVETIVDHTTRILCKHGLKNASEIQYCAGVWIYPKEYFAPKDVDTREVTITENTRTIHHYDASWAEWYDRAAGIRGPKLKRLLGAKIGGFINSAIYAVQRFGLIGCVKKLLDKIK